METKELTVKELVKILQDKTFEDIEVSICSNDTGIEFIILT